MQKCSFLTLTLILTRASYRRNSLWDASGRLAAVYASSTEAMRQVLCATQ